MQDLTEEYDQYENAGIDDEEYEQEYADEQVEGDYTEEYAE